MVMLPQAVERSWMRPSTSSTRFCDFDGCTQTTREGKPFCPEHVEEHPYVRAILETLAQREAEEAAVKRRGEGAVNPQGLTARELVLHLSLHGARTLERLSRELQLDGDILEGYVQALVARGVVGLSRTHRGSTVVELAV